MTTLGQEMHVAIWAIRGKISPGEGVRLTKLMVRFAKMKTGGMRHQAWLYPLPSGQGGVGRTIVHPCYTIVQPFVESYANLLVPGLIGVDTWQELDGFYLILNSCKRFNIFSVTTRLRKHWEVVDCGWTRASVNPGVLTKIKNGIRRLMEAAHTNKHVRKVSKRLQQRGKHK